MKEERSGRMLIGKLLGWILFLTALLTMFIATPAWAKEEDLTVSIPVTVRVGGNRPQSLTYQVNIEAEGNAPLPEVTKLTAETSGSTALEFGPITYTSPGIYHYRISQVMESRPYFTFDDRTYAVTVQVLRDSDGDLFAEILAFVGSSTGSKAGEIAFENTYTKSNSGSGDSDWDPDPAPTVSPSPESSPTKVSPERGTGSGNGESSDDIKAVPTPAIPEEGSSVADVGNPKNQSGSPKTGDSSQTAMWLSMGAGSAVLLIALIVLKRRSEEENGD